MEKYKYKGVHKKFKVKGELHHFISDELFCGELLSSYYEGLSDGESNQIKRITDEELAGLGLVRKEKLDVAKNCLEYISNGEVRYLDILNCYNTKQATKKELKEFAQQALKEIEEK